jgi:membrane protease YdiL (CAAX protease family)
VVSRFSNSNQRHPNKIAENVNSPISIIDQDSDASTVAGRSIRGVLLQTLLIYFLCAFIALVVRVLRMDFDDSWASTLALQGTMAVAAVVSMKRDSMQPAEVGLHLPSSGVLRVVDVFGVVFIALTVSFLWLVGRFPPVHRSASRSLMSDLFWLCAFVPVAEELFIRGWFQTAIYRVLGELKRTWVILLSASTFALLHLFWILRGAPVSSTCVVVLGTFGVGLLCARSRDQSGSIVPPILLHAIYNLTGVLIEAGLQWIIAHPSI